MRLIKNIVIHTTATPQSTSILSIQNYWRNNLGWKAPGYHIIVKPDGSTVRLAEDWQVTNGVAGHNANSLHVSYIGGVDSKGKSVDNRTPAQKKALAAIVLEWKIKYPAAKVLGHRDFPDVAKDCPCFPAINWWDMIETTINR